VQPVKKWGGHLMLFSQTGVTTVNHALPPILSTLASEVPLKWVGEGETIKIGPYLISDPLTYVSAGIPHQEEASCINTYLPIGNPTVEGNDALGYWPQYARISPHQRARYLAWLAGGMTGELTEIGYAFIYFYGLERRIFVDHADVEAVLSQAANLMRAYSASRSFFGYSSRFIAFVLARVGLENIPRETFDILFSKALIEFDDDTIAVALAWLYHENLPLPSMLAFEVVRNDIRASRSIVVTRVAEHFHTLFDKKYAERFGAGLPLKVAVRDRLLEYKPASPTVMTGLPHYTLPGVRIPNVLGLPSQFKPLVDLWDECIDELKPLSREMGKGRDALDRQAYQALPAALKAEIEHPDQAKWEGFATANTNDSNIVITTVGKLALLCEFEQRPKLTARQSEELATIAADVGFVLVPDSRVVKRGYKWDEMVALFRPPEGRPGLPTDNKYQAAVLMLEMGMAIAAADGTVEQEEVDQVISFLKGQFLLVPNDARRIDAYKEILVQQPPPLANLVKRLQTVLTAEHLEVVCQFLVGIAAANGSIDKQERATLRRFYTALGLPISKLDELIARLLGPIPEAVEIQQGTSSPGEKIPAPGQAPVFSLNAAELQRILQETEQVAQLLGRALAASAEEEAEAIVSATQPGSGEPEKTSTPEAPRVVSMPHAYAGLDVRYHSVTTELLSRATWNTEELDALARKYNLMPSGLLETINTWSDENHGDFLVEEGAVYTINRTLQEKIQCQA
ncbi:MAG: TerB N-terminal domain-containing protein, partial [Lentisphaeria bacterium]